MVRRKSYLCALVSLIFAIVLFSACAPNPRMQLISPNMVVIGEGETFVPPTPTPRPRIADLSPEEIYVGLPDSIADLLPGDPANGQSLTVPYNCISCHQLDLSLVDVAPTWAEVADTAVGRAQNLGSPGPAEYLYISIVNPNAFIVDGYSSDIMPATYVDDLSEQDLADILTYLLTLRSE